MQMLAIANKKGNAISGLRLAASLEDGDRLSQLSVDIISAVLDGDGAATPATGNYGNGLSAIAAEGEQKGQKLFIVGVDRLDDIFLTFFCCE